RWMGVGIIVPTPMREFEEATKMNFELLKSFFLWCTLINYGILLVWAIVFIFAHDWHFRLVTLWFRKLSVEQYDMVNFVGIAFFKIAIILFSLVPYLALCVINC